MKDLIGNIPAESGFKKSHRLHQGWWRTFVLNEKEGRYWDNKNKKWASVCNRINNGQQTFKNFVSKEIGQMSSTIAEENETRKSGIIEKDRLFNNLLSSQPLAFNFFGFLKLYPDLALDFIKKIRPDISSVQEIVFEHAPEASSDHSAFDFGFMVTSSAGRGFIGFECKYTDTFSYKRSGSEFYYGEKEDKRYKDYYPVFSSNRQRLPDDYNSYVRDKGFNQLFRNEILALQMSGFDFIGTGLFCHHQDTHALKSGYEFQKKVGNRINDFTVLTFADYFEHLEKLNLTWAQRETVMLLWARYCGLKLSQEFEI